MVRAWTFYYAFDNALSSGGNNTPNPCSPTTDSHGAKTNTPRVSSQQYQVLALAWRIQSHSTATTVTRAC